MLEISTGRGIAGNAGHTDPAVRRAGGGFELSRYEYGLPVGLLKKTGCRDRAFELHPGDCIFAYSDGVTEAADAFGKMFGGERMIAVLNECADAGPEALIRHVREAVDRFADGAPQSDDITMLCLKYHGTER